MDLVHHVLAGLVPFPLHFVADSVVSSLRSASRGQSGYQDLLPGKIPLSKASRLYLAKNIQAGIQCSGTCKSLGRLRARHGFSHCLLNFHWLTISSQNLLSFQENVKRERRTGSRERVHSWNLNNHLKKADARVRQIEFCNVYLILMWKGNF